MKQRNAVAVAAIVVAFTMTACDSSRKDHAQPASSTRPSSERLRVENDQVVTIASTRGSVPRRDRVPAEMLEGGFRCAGVNAV